jgi:hypothetical protein
MPVRNTKVVESRADLREKFAFTPKQDIIITNPAPFKLAVGGIRSGKTCGALMYGVIAFCLRFVKCDILVLRRNYKELESGAILDFKTFVDERLYTYNDSKHIATFRNGSRVVFGHCQNNKMRDIEQYLGQAYPFILVDECAQFSPDAWELLSTRNTVNAGCEPDENGNFPIPEMWGCTNPLGPFWDYYQTTFVQKKPYLMPDACRKDNYGRWYVTEAGELRKVYDPRDYFYCQSTVLDNPHILKRDPNLLPRLQALPKAKRDKMLLGLLDAAEGQFFECFDPTYHVVDPKETDENGEPTIIWQDWQPIWLGWDFGIGHWSATYFFTKALIRCAGGEYKLKTVCYKEIVERGKDGKTLVDILVSKATSPTGCSLRKGVGCKNSDGSWKHDPADGGCPAKLSAIYFSWEKFSRSLEAHGPDVEFSKLLVSKGLCPVTRSTRDRQGSALYMYEGLSQGRLCVTKNCHEIITAIPRLQTNPENLGDVLKPEGASKFDDCYDGFRYGYYGESATRREPQAEKDRRIADSIADPFVRRLYLYKQEKDASARAKKATYTKQPSWMYRAS